MNKLTKLTINKFRNVVPTTLEFRPGINVVLGKNAAGKTTLLNLLATVIGADKEALRDDVMDVSCHAFGEALDFEHTITKKQIQEPSLPFEPGRYLSDGLSPLQRTDLFHFKDGPAILRVEVFPNTVLIEHDGKHIRVERMFKESLSLSVMHALMQKDKSSRATGKAMEIYAAMSSGIGRMDESLESFKDLLQAEIKTRPAPFIAIWSLNVPVSMSSMDLDKLGASGTSATFLLRFLDRAAHVLGYDSARARLDIERLNQESVRFSNLRFFFKKTGEEVSHDLLSYGQKRLLAFFAHVDASRDVVIADELVNGLHHEWISACLDEIGERQAFLTSQNPLLLDFLRFDSAEEVRRAFVLCEHINGETGAQLIWRNPTDEEADSFFAAYQTGMQRVSDILITKGLW